MARIFPGRYTASHDGDVVVFLIGMRINKLWKIHKWWPVFLAMRPMVQELQANPASGMLHASFGLLFGGPAVVQYWRSFEDLERFARDGAGPHMPAWRRFNRAIAGSGDVGIWHETYHVRAGDFEVIYGNMPEVGLARASTHRPLRGAQTAALRMGAREQDVAPVEGYQTPAVGS